MTALPDVNLLVALAWPRHAHHEAAHGWFANRTQGAWATCPITQCGFVRVLSNPSIVGVEVRPAEALAVLAKMTADSAHRFWADDVPLPSIEIAPHRYLTGHRQLTDYYLLGLAVHHGGVLVTFDKGVATLVPQNSAHRQNVLVVPA